MISLDTTKCIGCCSCSNVCPSKNITREDLRDKRTIRYKKCSEFCDICVESCPCKALTLVAQGEDVEIAFDLVKCTVCGEPFATEEMLERIRSSVPQNLRVDSAGQSWVEICPMCRRDLERERAARPVIKERA
jgi:ferredoxin